MIPSSLDCYSNLYHSVLYTRVQSIIISINKIDVYTYTVEYSYKAFVYM